VLGYRAAAAASRGELDRAESLLTFADERLSSAGDTAALAALRIDALHGTLERARRAAAGGDEALASRLRSEVDAAVARASTGIPPQKLRASLRLLEAARRRDAAEPTLVPAADASWFAPPGAERVELGRRRNLHGLVAALLEARRAGANAVSTDALFRAGWPGARASKESAKNRIRVGIATRRRLGLRGYLVTVDDGYALDPERAIDVDDR